MENQAWVYILRFQTIQTSSRLQQNQVTLSKQENPSWTILALNSKTKFVVYCQSWQNQEKFVKYTSRSKESIIIKQLEEGKIAN